MEACLAACFNLGKSDTGSRLMMVSLVAVVAQDDHVLVHVVLWIVIDVMDCQGVHFPVAAQGARIVRLAVEPLVKLHSFIARATV